MRAQTLRETETIELKKSLAELKEGLISLVAVLNKHGGGELWFGMAPSGKSAGLQVNDKTLRDLSQGIAAHVEPKIYPHITTQMVDGKTCIRVRFRGQDAPYFAYGRAWIRVADEDRQFSAKALQNFVLDRHQQALHWDSQPSDLPRTALDTVQIRRFVERAGLGWDSAANALNKLEFIKSGRVLNAAKLFFAKKAPIELRCAVFAGVDSATIVDRHDFEGHLPELIEEAQKYILKNIRMGMTLDGLYRVDVPEISTAASREAVINAFCHRDWHDPDCIHIAIFKDRVEIRSPGTLFGGLTLDDMQQGNLSRRCNPLIANLLRRIHMVEAWGRGVPLILKNAPAASFQELAGVFITSFKRPSFLEKAVQNSVLKTPKKHQRNTKENLLSLLKKQPRLSIKTLADLAGVSVYSVQHHLKAFKAAGQLRHVGSTKSGCWEIL